MKVLKSLEEMQETVKENILTYCDIRGRKLWLKKGEFLIFSLVGGFITILKLCFMQA